MQKKKKKLEQGKKTFRGKYRKSTAKTVTRLKTFRENFYEIIKDNRISMLYKL